MADSVSSLLLTQSSQPGENSNQIVAARHTRLTKAAKGHAGDMVSRDYFSHDTIDGSDFATRIHRAGYRGLTLGEDLAWGSGTLGTARAIVRAWMHSQGHRANILNRKYREMGVGVSLGVPGGAGGLGGATYAVDFGRAS